MFLRFVGGFGIQHVVVGIGQSYRVMHSLTMSFVGDVGFQSMLQVDDGAVVAFVFWWHRVFWGSNMQYLWRSALRSKIFH
jgi:hypothetical protein